MMLYGLEYVVSVAYFLGVGFAQNNGQDCASVSFIEYPGHYQHGGRSLRTPLLAYSACVAQCRRDDACVSLDYDYGTFTCYIHTQDNMRGQVIEDDCCIHTMKTCVRPGAGSETTTTLPAPGRGRAAAAAPEIDIGFGLVERSLFPQLFATNDAQNDAQENGAPPAIPRYPDPTTLPPTPRTTGGKAKPGPSGTGFGSLSEANLRMLINMGLVTPPNLPKTTTTQAPRVTLPRATTRPAPRVTQPPPTTPGADPTTKQPPAVPRPTTTPRVEKSTPPSLIKTKRIGDSGICPDPFGVIRNSSLPDGEIQPEIQDAEGCKAACVINANCTAATFNRDTFECRLHLEVVNASLLQRDTEKCCDHYWRNTCESECYSHVAVNASEPNAGAVRVGEGQQVADLSLTTCPGMCAVTEVITMTADGASMEAHTVSRGCHMLSQQPAAAGCRTSERRARGKLTITMLCACEHSACNALGVMAQMALQLRLPFDGTPEDVGPYHRHGAATNVTYDGYDSVTGSAACFNGHAFVKVWSLAGFLYSSIQAYEIEKQSKLTITFWMKRTKHKGYMTLLSNGRKEGPIDISSATYGPVTQLYAGVTLRNGKHYVAMTEAPMDEWVFVALVVGVPGSRLSEAQLQLFVGDQAVDEGTPSSHTTLPVELLQSSSSPLVVGAKPTSGRRGGYTNHFTGCIDEVSIFSEALSVETLQAIRDMGREFMGVLQGEETTVDATTEAMTTEAMTTVGGVTGDVTGDVTGADVTDSTDSVTSMETGTAGMNTAAGGTGATDVTGDVTTSAGTTDDTTDASTGASITPAAP